MYLIVSLIQLCYGQGEMFLIRLKLKVDVVSLYTKLSN